MDLGHERRGLLVADQDVAYRRPGQCIGEADVLLSRDTEDARDAFVLQAAHQEIGDSLLIFSHVWSVANRTARPSARTRARQRSTSAWARTLTSLSLP